MRRLSIASFLLFSICACKSDDNTTSSSIDGQWYLYKIKDNTTGTSRSPKDGSGMESADKLYFLTLNSGSMQGKTLANDFSGNYKISGNSDINIKIEMISEVLDPKESDSYYYVDNLEGNLKYEVISGELYLNFENNTKCFIFKPN